MLLEQIMSMDDDEVFTYRGSTIQGHGIIGKTPDRPIDRKITGATPREVTDFILNARQTEFTVVESLGVEHGYNVWTF